MNWRRGLFRAWAVFAVVWVASTGGAALWRSYTDPWRVVSVTPVPASDLPGDSVTTPPSGRFQNPNPADSGLRAAPEPPRPASSVSELWPALMRILGIPLVVLAASLAARWVVLGFLS